MWYTNAKFKRIRIIDVRAVTEVCILARRTALKTYRRRNNRMHINCVPTRHWNPKTAASIVCCTCFLKVNISYNLKINFCYLQFTGIPRAWRFSSLKQIKISYLEFILLVTNAGLSTKMMSPVSNFSNCSLEICIRVAAE